MKKRVIAYDLHHKDTNDYEELYETLEDLNGKQLSESVYGIETDKSQKEIEEAIVSCVEDDDTIHFISVNDKNELFWKKIK